MILTWLMSLVGPGDCWIAGLQWSPHSPHAPAWVVGRPVPLFQQQCPVQAGVLSLQGMQPFCARVASLVPAPAWLTGLISHHGAPGTFLGPLRHLPRHAPNTPSPHPTCLPPTLTLPLSTCLPPPSHTPNPPSPW